MSPPLVPSSPAALANRQALRSLLWLRRSRRVADEPLLAPTAAWLNTLPKGVRPFQLQLGFARIANELVRLWPDALACDRYLYEKVVDHRGNRRGFPPLVQEELVALRAYSERRRQR